MKIFSKHTIFDLNLKQNKNLCFIYKLNFIVIINNTFLYIKNCQKSFKIEKSKFGNYCFKLINTKDFF